MKPFAGVALAVCLACSGGVAYGAEATATSGTDATATTLKSGPSAADLSSSTTTEAPVTTQTPSTDPPATDPSATTDTTDPSTATGTTDTPPSTDVPTTDTTLGPDTTIVPTPGTNPATPGSTLVNPVPGRTIDALDMSGQLTARQLEVLKISSELDQMDAQLDALVEEYNLLQIELQAAKQTIAQMQDELQLAQGELLTADQTLQMRVVATYKSQPSAIEVLLNTTDMSDFIKRVGLLITIARSDRSRVDEVGSLRSRVDRLLDDMSRHIYDLTLATQRVGDQRRLIESQLAERKVYLAKLGADVRVMVEQQREMARNVVPAGVDLSAYMTADGQGVVRTALTYLGVPYVWGGATPSGFDCSGLVQYVYQQHGIYLPHYSAYQAEMGVEVPYALAQAGDLVAFGNPVHHIGIYMGSGLFVQAPKTGDVVKVSRLAERSDLTHIRRIVVSQPAAVVAAGSTPAGASPTTQTP